MSDLVIHALGAPAIEYRGSAISVDTRKAIALLVYLAVEPQQHSRDAIAALLWPDYDQSRARAALRRTLSVLHKSLDEQYLAIERERIALSGPTPPWVDALEFRRLLASRRTHGHAEKEVCVACLGPLKQAAALYRDDFLAGFSLRDETNFEEWQLAQRLSLRSELEIALAALTRCYILVGELREAVDACRRWLALDPLNEQAHRFLMRLYDWTGQRSSALRQYRECVQILERELGAPPLEVTTRLYDAIRTNRAPGPPDPASAQTPGDQPPPSEEAPQAHEGAAQIGQQAQPQATPLIGREAELDAAIAAYTMSAQSGRLVIIEGEAGIGKTRLADELVSHMRSHGSVVGVARCYEGEGSIAFSAIVELLRSVVGREPATRLKSLPDIWLAEALRLAPELGAERPNVATPGPLDTPGAQTRFYEGVRETLIAACVTGTPPGALVLDDAQWIDDASLDTLSYLVRRIERQPICIVLTWRSDTVGAQHRLRRLLAETQRNGRATTISLQRLDQADVGEWLQRGVEGIESTRAQALAVRLYQETEGLPFFISEYVNALSSGAYVADGAAWAAPVAVHDLLRSRLRTLTETGWQSLTTAAVLGRSFDFDTVRDVSGRSEEETAAALDELRAQGLITEAPETQPGAVSYDFTHDKLRALVYGETSLARRRLLHRRAAEALLSAGKRSGQGAERAAQIAQHYAASGDESAAADQHTIAGARARELYAHADAIRHFRRALELGYPDAAELHEAIADAYTLLGDYPQALQSYAQALQTAPGDAEARIQHKLGVAHARRSQWQDAERHFQQAIDILVISGGDSAHRGVGEQARVHADWSLTARHLGRLGQARDHAETALRLAADVSDLHALAQAHNILGALASSEGESDVALRHLQESLALAERLDDATLRAAALNNLALAIGQGGETARALPLAEAALALCVTQGDRHHEAALHNTVADMLHSLGHTEDAMAHLKQAVSIYAEIGVEAGAVQPGIWSMVDW